MEPPSCPSAVQAALDCGAMAVRAPAMALRAPAMVPRTQPFRSKLAGTCPSAVAAETVVLFLPLPQILVVPLTSGKGFHG